jgi:transcriptional regulator with XRE-family HTH domain
MSSPSPPPEAVLLRRVREAAGLKLPAVAREAGVSVARWSQVENGYETRAGMRRPVRARAGTLAHMAAALPLSPERLATEGERPDAADVLREIQHGEAAPRPPQLTVHDGMSPDEAALSAKLDELELSDAEKAGLMALFRGLRSTASERQRA